jgi:hypothetical protein
MNDIKHIVPGLESCNRKCRKCRWRDGFSGACMLMNKAVEYIKRLESDNSKKIVYCKDCRYCEFEQREYKYHGSDRYTCKHRDGLPILPELNPMDYCSRGKRKEDANEG